ncbi:single-stranded DNA-binding protein [Corynebacterium sphenisci]|uniref:single-stranded DNA-binding protein n=1 Tax=Corynebacterium sphenisci TaxID=191493 RepID=UPI0026DEA3CE|nr:single-stranded DNA-binding protein [Corynebacterium sphenisci]MDO5730810.1 single-stranded DNA-binding protein [Corynebacterium sphenisci]
MRNLNTITITGRAGADAEHRATPGGRDSCQLRICHDRQHFDESSGQWVKDNATWWRVTLWDRRAEEIAQSIRKGDLVTVTGRAEVTEFDRRDGTRGWSAEILADHISLSAQPIGKTTASPATGANSDPWAAGPGPGAATGDEAPF